MNETKVTKASETEVLIHRPTPPTPPPVKRSLADMERESAVYASQISSIQAKKDANDALVADARKMGVKTAAEVAAAKLGVAEPKPMEKTVLGAVDNVLDVTAGGR